MDAAMTVRWRLTRKPGLCGKSMASSTALLATWAPFEVDCALDPAAIFAALIVWVRD